MASAQGSAHSSAQGPAQPPTQRPAVVVTRPLGQSAALLALLASAGFESIEFPLIDIGPVADAAPLHAALGELYAPAPLGFALVVFVSPNAIDHAFAALSSAWPLQIPIGVVGPGSVAALGRQGVASPAYTLISPATGATATATQTDPVTIPRRCMRLSKRISAPMVSRTNVY